MTLEIEPGFVDKRRLSAMRPLLYVPSLKWRGPGAALKFAFDRAAALAALIVLFPVMLVVALAILKRRDGPVFFSHTRIGRDGRPFKCHKFRTMIPDRGNDFDQILAIDPIARDDWATRRKIYRDPRISQLGAFLRSTSLDELPQFWNVLKGDMSLVGPRPITEEELSHYGDHAEEYLSVRPGITGVWQVSGRSDATYPERVRMDVNYVSNRSFAGDLKIVLRTVRVVLVRQGAF